jgi:hypothetical protein
MKTFEEWAVVNHPEFLDENWKLKYGVPLAVLAASTGVGAGLGSFGHTISKFQSGLQDRMGQVVGIEDAGNVERSREEVREKLAQNTGGRTGLGAAAGALIGAAALASGSKRRRYSKKN